MVVITIVRYVRWGYKPTYNVWGPHIVSSNDTPQGGGYEKNIEKPSDNQLVMAMENPQLVMAMENPHY